MHKGSKLKYFSLSRELIKIGWLLCKGEVTKARGLMYKGEVTKARGILPFQSGHLAGKSWGNIVEVR